MALPDSQPHDWLTLIFGALGTIGGGIAALFLAAFRSGQRYAEILTRLNNLDKRFDTLENRINQHLDRQD